jgi:shikimate 5-dehydrogenase
VLPKRNVEPYNKDGVGAKKRLERLRQEEWKYFDALGAGGYNAPSDMTI